MICDFQIHDIILKAPIQRWIFSLPSSIITLLWSRKKLLTRHIFHCLFILYLREYFKQSAILRISLSLTESMEGEKKRKGADHHRHGEANSAGGRRRKEGGVKDEVAAAAQPSEEEVEEFFTILRRMHVAVKYFEKSRSEINGDGLKLTPLEEGAVNEVKIDNKRDAENGGLDLNSVPESEY